MTEVAARPAIPAVRHAQRLEAAADLARDRGIDALLIGVGADLRYLTGYRALALERLTMLVVRPGERPTLIAPRLEALPARGAAAAAAGDIGVQTWDETDDPVLLVASLVGAAGRVAVSDRLWAMFVLRLQAALAGAEFQLASPVLEELRIVKDADEVALLRLAAHAADRALAAIIAGRLIGRTEADVSREIGERLVAEGHETVEFAIVGSGPNSASPHHDPGERVIRAGEPVLFDIGGTYSGYASDITRTVWISGDPGHGPDDEYRRLYDVLEAAQSAAAVAVRPGLSAERVDAIARERIATAGYGANFIHRIGHGIGLEGHEEPYLVAGSERELREGMAFSVEPGIYLEGRYGARIEDIVVCGATGPDVLNQLPRSLAVVSGV
jgi:Xaa-Pro aminopeptidase